MSHKDQSEIVRAILLEEWDPVGFGPLLPADEYDAYIPGILRLLENHCTAEQLEAHLIKIEKEYFGAVRTDGKARNAAKKLLSSWSSIR